VKESVVAHSFDNLAARLQAAGVGFTEVLPLERVLDAPQARHPGKLRDLSFRGFEFEVPEFPRLHAGDGMPTRPPPDLGEHTAALLQSAGVNREQYETLLQTGTVAEATPNAFAWAPVRRDV